MRKQALSDLSRITKDDLSLESLWSQSLNFHVAQLLNAIIARCFSYTLIFAVTLQDRQWSHFYRWGNWGSEQVPMLEAAQVIHDGARLGTPVWPDPVLFPLCPSSFISCHGDAYPIDCILLWNHSGCQSTGPWEYVGPPPRHGIHRTVPI